MLPEFLPPWEWQQYFAAPTETDYTVPTSGAMMVAKQNQYRTHLWFSTPTLMSLSTNSIIPGTAGGQGAIVVGTGTSIFNNVQLNIWEYGQAVQLAWYARVPSAGSPGLLHVTEQFAQGAYWPGRTIPGRKRYGPTIQPDLYGSIRDIGNTFARFRQRAAYRPQIIPTNDGDSLDLQRRYHSPGLGSWFAGWQYAGAPTIGAGFPS